MFFQELPLALSLRVSLGSLRNGIMYHHGKRVDSKSISTAVDMLLDFFQTFQKKIILVGHNVESFDSPILMYALDKCKKLESFTNIVDGFLDTLKLFRTERPGLSSYRQEYLCKNLAGFDYDAHDAISDVLSLQSLINYLNIGLENVNARTASLTSASAVDFYRYSNVVQSNLPSLQPLISQKIISCPIAKKIAGSGLQLKHLELAYSRDRLREFILCLVNSVESLSEYPSQERSQAKSLNILHP